MIKRIVPLMILLVAGACSSQIDIGKIPDDTVLTSSHRFLKLNPYGNAPLSAELYLSPLEEALTITVKGQDDSDLSYTWETPTNKAYPVLGLYFQHTNTIIIETATVSKTNYIIVTNTPSEHIKSIDILVNKRPVSPERKNFLNFFNPVSSLTDLFATDDYGKIRWYLTSDRELHAMKFAQSNGEVIFSILDTKEPKLLTYSMTGKLISEVSGPKTHSYTVPEADKRYHHDMFFRNNGNMIVLDKSQYGVEDTILELNPKGEIVKEILIGDWIRKTVNGDPKNNTGLENIVLDSEDNPYDEYASGIRYPGMPPKQNAIDWAHINAVSFDEEREILYLSFRQHGIFAFDYNKETLMWIYIRSDYLSPTITFPFYNLPENFAYVYNTPKLQPYILKGSEGPDHPHAISFLGDNQLMVFDNSGNDGSSPQEGSRLLVFSVNEKTMTAKIDWEYRHRDTNGSYIYSQITSDIDKTAFGSYIGTFGAQTPYTYIEVTENKNVIFDMRLDISFKGAGDSDISVPIACPTARLLQNGIVLYRADYESIYPSRYQSID